jgi:hypothetical protein
MARFKEKQLNPQDASGEEYLKPAPIIEDPAGVNLAPGGCASRH